MKISNIFYSLLTTVLIVAILIVGKNIILPLLLAVLVWFLTKGVRAALNKIRFRNWYLPYWLQKIISLLIIISLLGLVSKMLIYNINKISEVLPVYETNIQRITMDINQKYNIDLFDWIKNYTNDFNFAGILGGLLNSFTDLLKNTFLIIIYVVFLMLEESTFKRKLNAMIHDGERYRKVSEILEKINNSINNYLALKTLVSIMTGVLSYIVLAIIKVDFAFFWAFLIFILNYIPTIGSLIATLFPAIIALVQFNTFTPFVLILVLIGAIQILVGNFVEPRLMGKTMNVSPFIVIVGLVFWGSIWGIIGMAFSVPIAVILINVFAQFQSTRGIAIMLSARGRV